MALKITKILFIFSLLPLICIQKAKACNPSLESEVAEAMQDIEAFLELGKRSLPKAIGESDSRYAQIVQAVQTLRGYIRSPIVRSRLAALGEVGDFISREIIKFRDGITPREMRDFFNEALRVIQKHSSKTDPVQELKMVPAWETKLSLAAPEGSYRQEAMRLLRRIEAILGNKQNDWASRIIEADNFITEYLYEEGTGNLGPRKEVLNELFKTFKDVRRDELFDMFANGKYEDMAFPIIGTIYTIQANGGDRGEPLRLRIIESLKTDPYLSKLPEAGREELANRIFESESARLEKFWGEDVDASKIVPLDILMEEAYSSLGL